MHLLILCVTWIGFATAVENLGLKSYIVTWSKSNDVTKVDGSTKHHQAGYRGYITVNLSPSEIQDIVNIHNDLRRIQGASNMEELSWNNVLAEMAQEWAERCTWTHGQPAQPANQAAPYDPVGQNLFQQTGGSRPNMTLAVLLWYEEINGYDYNTDTCLAYPCGHYTQVVWDNTREVGCGFYECSSFPYHYLVCNYGPAGNYPRKPFLKGVSCTQCTSGHQWCSNDLCKADCTTAGLGCTCNALCQNCGSMNAAACQCYCASGWMGGDCSEVCRDLDTTCGNGWPRYWCGDSQFPWVDENCPAFCEYCVEDDYPQQCNSGTTTTATPGADPCTVYPDYRQRCFQGGRNRRNCENAGCCWERMRGVPNCYIPG